MLTVFWEPEGLTVVNLREGESVIEVTTKCGMSQIKLKPATRSKQR
jgi:hypothetical protein